MVSTPSARSRQPEMRRRDRRRRPRCAVDVGVGWLEDRTLLSGAPATVSPADLVRGTPITLAADGSATQAGTLSTAGQIDYYQFVANITGRMSIRLTQTSGVGATPGVAVFLDGTE